MLTYDEQGRAFWNGERVPRTTEICRLLAPRFFTEEYFLNRGRIVHLILEWEDTGELDESSVDPNLTGYLEAYRRFKIATNWHTTMQEIKFFNEKYKYCGRADKVGQFGITARTKWIWVIDIKSGQPHEADQLQSPAYLFGLKSHEIPIGRCGDLYLKPSGLFRFVEVKDPTYKFQRFLNGIKKWKEQNGNVS
jgi:hypothetical protein